MGAERMKKQKRPILDTARGKLQIKAESNQKKPCRELRVARKTIKMAIRKHRAHRASQTSRRDTRGRLSTKGLFTTWNYYEI